MLAATRNEGNVNHWIERENVDLHPTSSHDHHSEAICPISKPWIRNTYMKYVKEDRPTPASPSWTRTPRLEKHLTDRGYHAVLGTKNAP